MTQSQHRVSVSDSFDKLDTAIGQLCWQLPLELLRQVWIALDDRVSEGNQGFYPDQLLEARDTARQILSTRS